MYPNLYVFFSYFNGLDILNNVIGGMPNEPKLFFDLEFDPVSKMITKAKEINLQYGVTNSPTISTIPKRTNLNNLVPLPKPVNVASQLNKMAPVFAGVPNVNNTSQLLQTNSVPKKSFLNRFKKATKKNNVPKKSFFNRFKKTKKNNSMPLLSAVNQTNETTLPVATSVTMPISANTPFDPVFNNSTAQEPVILPERAGKTGPLRGKRTALNSTIAQRMPNLPQHLLESNAATPLIANQHNNNRSKTRAKKNNNSTPLLAAGTGLLNM
jgi:hypothetical protein